MGVKINRGLEFEKGLKMIIKCYFALKSRCESANKEKKYDEQFIKNDFSLKSINGGSL